MDRYDNLDLECDGGGVSQKAALFGGMFKKSSKSAEPSVQAQDNISASSELSKSNDSLTDNNNTKEKGGVFKGMFKKPIKSAKEGSQQATISIQNQDLSASSDNITDNNKSSKDKSGVLGGILRRSPKPGMVRRPSQDLLENGLSASNDSLSENANTKETGGIFSGMFKKKPFGARTQSQDDLSAPSELSGSGDNSSESNNTKEKGGIFSGVFKKPKLLGAKSQDDLTMDSELSASSDSLAEKSSKGGVAAKILKNPFTSSSQDKEKPEDLNENVSSTEKPKAKQNGFSAMMKSTFYTDKQEKSSDPDTEETPDNGESQPSHKQNKLADAMTKLNPFRSPNKYERQTGSDDEDPPASSEKSSGSKQSAMVGAMSKLNLFRSANKKDTEDTETLKETEKQVEEKPKLVKSNMIHRERKERSETPLVPPRPTEEEMKGTSTYDKVKTRGTEDIQVNKDMISTQKKEKPAETPAVPVRPSEEELNGPARRGLQKQKNNHQNQSDDEGLKEDESAEGKEGDELNPPESKTTKVKKHKHRNPFMPRAAAKAPSDDEGLKEEDKLSSKGEEKEEEKKEEEGNDKPEETKVKKPKRHNPFMPRVKAKVIQKNAQDGAEGNTAENDGGNRTLLDQLEDFRIDQSQPEDTEDVDLMEWWDTVEAWEDTPQNEDMTEKEEAKAFAVTAAKVQKGIRLFNKLFSERAESLWQHVIDLNSIADGLDKFNKKTKIAQITGGSTSAIGGVATIAGLALAPVTMGTSLIVTAVGLGVATAGGLTSAGAGISNQVNNSMDRKKVEKIVEDYQEKMVDLNKCLKFIKQGIENLRRFDLIRMKKDAYNQDFPVLSSSFYEDGAMAGKAILINANEIMRVVQIANVAGSTAARAVQIASMATGVLTGLFVGMDIYFVAKDSKELKKGAKSEFAAKIREVATQLHDGLVELNGLREELQSTSRPQNDEGNDKPAPDTEKKKEDENEDSSEDEIDRIKKAIKKDIENREYV
ncbi:splicing factor, arginine/serine-rich 19-like isoform X1 [Thunnus maccoyii]|uniref:splicing factor, arginine/serine-rich 19-like isoform X1 n=1 Tax=Thunnus maccoyii TaxID=8240 RepID=UPI001C4DC610|nr:splicing factor, arginine/serine-rich 19-like isoform X1 [Thunnus maccoyii]XP_042283842.1 splicing factor, arginine/serine-rich 19-like isoform X1 [Thunnus maccoyii]